MVNWNAPDIKQWKETARNLQQSYCDSLGDSEWHHIDKGEETILLRNVGYGLFGNPPCLPTVDNLETGYKEEQLEKIKIIKQQLTIGINMKYEGIHFSCVFVSCKIFDEQFTQPVFRAKAEKSQKFVYVDAAARIYDSWSSYLSDNVLPKCLFCAPTKGTYTDRNSDGTINVIFGTSPACDLVNRTASFLDTVATVAAVSATVVGVAALCTIPIAGPIAAATTIAGTSSALYGASRTSYTLYDRGVHGQSIDPLSNSEARLCWLSLVGSGLGMAQGAMLKSMTKMATAGDVMSKAGRIAYLVVQTGSLTVNGIGIINGMAVLIEKSENKTLTAQDIFQFNASVLFFTNSVINYKTAGTIIKEVQHEIINSHREGLGFNARKLFNKQTGKLRGPDELHGNANVVKQLNKINNSKDLFEMMVDRNIDNKKVKLTPEGFKGNLVVNENLKIHPLKMLEIKPESRQAIYTSTRNYENGKIDKDTFHKNMKGICKEYNIMFESMQQDAAKRVSGILVNGRKIFANATPHEIERMSVIMSNTLNADKKPEILELAIKFAEKQNCRTPGDFMSYTEYFVQDLTDRMKVLEQKYVDSRNAVKLQPGFNQSQFDKEWGIKQGEQRKVHFKNQLLNEYRDGSGYDDLTRKFNDLKGDVSMLNAQCQPGFFNDNSATYHYVKHRHFGSKELTPAEYFALAEEVVGQPTNITNSMLSQDGQVTMITYKEPVRGVFAILIRRNYEQGTGIATVMYKKDLIL